MYSEMSPRMCDPYYIHTYIQYRTRLIIHTYINTYILLFHLGCQIALYESESNGSSESNPLEAFFNLEMSSDCVRMYDGSTVISYVCMYVCMYVCIGSVMHNV